MTLRNRKSKILIERIDILRDAMQCVKNKLPYDIKAIVILPDHIHALWKLPQDDDYSIRWQKIKGKFTHQLIKCGIDLNKIRKGEYDLWQHRYWEHTIRYDLDFEGHVNYIHYNPVKHGYVKNVKDWPYSSFHSYVKKGLLNKNWAGDDSDRYEDFGE